MQLQYLLTILTGIFAEGFVSGRLVVDGAFIWLPAIVSLHIF